MISRIHTAKLWHRRYGPVEHEFEYTVYTFSLALDELPVIDASTRLFGYNRFRVWALHDRDYLRGESTPLRERILEVAAEHGIDAEGVTVTLVTLPRTFHYVFNPVSFYYLHDAAGELRAAIAEVNNTFGDRHLYVLRDLVLEEGLFRARDAKAFHVSPFFDMRGEYVFRFADIRERLDIRIDLVREGQADFKAWLVETQSEPVTPAALRSLLRRFPLSAALNMPRILRQAMTLYFRKRLAVYHRPDPVHPNTIVRVPPDRLERFCRARVLQFLGRLQRGVLSLTLPGGETVVRGSGSAPRAEMTVRSHTFFKRVLFGGDIGFGESFMAREWDTPDLPGLLSLFAVNLAEADDRKIALSWLGRIGARIRHALRPNTTAISRRNIREHYDLSNDFFRTFLDETMMYSCGLYLNPSDSLEQAQRNKLWRLIDLARIRPEHHVLEIGTGWGGFAIECARQTGCRLTTITLSKEQRAFALERVREAGLEDRIDILLCDYRSVAGRFDRIVSIEMLEAVGHRFYGAFFQACDRCLTPDGLVALQVITIPDQRYDAYRFSSDWIQKHIFPGGMLPSLTELCRAMTRHSGLMVERLDNIGPHYEPTLRAWRERFVAARDRVRALGFDETFRRKWEYYLAYCEAGFATRTLNDLHLLLTRSGNTAALEVPPPVASKRN